MPPSSWSERTMILPQTAEYAVRIMAFFASQPAGTPHRSVDIADSGFIPPHYASKVLQRLVSAGLLSSVKGRSGGFLLTRDPADIPLREVLNAADVSLEGERCAFGWGACDPDHPCPLHPMWAEVKGAVRIWCETRTLADVGPMPDHPPHAHDDAQQTKGG